MKVFIIGLAIVMAFIAAAMWACCSVSGGGEDG